MARRKNETKERRENPTRFFITYGFFYGIIKRRDFNGSIFAARHFYDVLIAEEKTAILIVYRIWKMRKEFNF
jgi:hypothetical protein